MTIKPLNDRVLVTRTEEESMSAGGIIIPETAKEKPTTALIVAVGPGLRLEDGSRQEMSVAIGDKVILGKYAGTEITSEGKTMLLLREDEIFAVID